MRQKMHDEQDGISGHIADDDLQPELARGSKISLTGSTRPLRKSLQLEDQGIDGSCHQGQDIWTSCGTCQVDRVMQIASSFSTKPRRTHFKIHRALIR